MDWLTFITELSKNLAWPVAVTILLFSSRRSIENLLPRLERFKHKETEIAFSTMVTSMEEKAEYVAESGSDLMPDLKAEENRIISKIAFAPHPAINQAYSILERELLEFYDSILSDTSREVLSQREARELRFSHGSSEELESNIRELRKIRKYIFQNNQFDKNDLTLNQVRSYVELALDCTQRIRALSANK